MPMMQGFEACHQSSKLRGLMSHAKRLEQLDAMLAQWVEPELKAHCQVVALEKGVLTLLVDGSTWLTWLRFSSAQWLPEVQKQAGFEQVSRIAWRLGDLAVAPPLHATAKRHRPLPAEAKVALKELMLALEDSPLRSALKRMVEREP